MKFGTSGLRGLVTDLEGRLSALYSTAFAHHLLHNGLAQPADEFFVGEDYRPSGNAPEMRCYIEAKDQDGAQALLRQGLGMLRNWAAASGHIYP